MGISRTVSTPRPRSRSRRGLTLLIHHMGGNLADHVTQGLAQGDMFRTTPLWGIGRRLFFQQKCKEIFSCLAATIVHRALLVASTK